MDRLGSVSPARVTASPSGYPRPNQPAQTGLSERRTSSRSAQQTTKKREGPAVAPSASRRLRYLASVRISACRGFASLLPYQPQRPPGRPRGYRDRLPRHRSKRPDCELQAAAPRGPGGKVLQTVESGVELRRGHGRGEDVGPSRSYRVPREGRRAGRGRPSKRFEGSGTCRLRWWGQSSSSPWRVGGGQWRPSEAA